ncbi:MAG: DUF2339 domain-containing protein [Candidatus Hydrogenedentes bacterium]|nr:DUF2339 domain-containing protein [Candidatus Hydrogenedentota bacterium]
MHYDDELQALRRDLDELLHRASGIKNRITAIERELKLESIARAQVDEDKPVVAAAPVAPKAPLVEPPPLPPMSAAPSKPTIDEAPSRAKEPAAVIPEFAEAQVKAAPQAPKPKRDAEVALPGASFEERIWKYWMPRVAGVLFAIGIAWVLYLVGPHTPPVVRVAFGYLCSAALIAVAWKLEKKYLQYARVLYGTAIGVSYFVTYAAHYIQAARVIESDTVGIGLLVAVVVAWGIVAQIRKSKIVATLVTMLGHLTMGLTYILTEGDLAKYSIFGVVILGFGSAFFLLYNRWYYVAVVGLVGCYLNHALWTMLFIDATPMISFRLSFGLLWVYMLTFALAELFCAEDLRRSEIPTKFRTLFVSTNTVLFFCIGTLTLMRYGDMYEKRDQFLLAYSCILGLIGLGYLRLRSGDPLYNAYLTKAVSAFTLFLAARYGQGTLTASFAVESVVLLYSSRRSGLVVTRVLAFGAAVLTVMHGLYIFSNEGSVPYSDPNYWRKIIESSFAVIGMFAASQLYQRTDWSSRAPRFQGASRETLDLLWDVDLVSEPGTRNRRKPFGGLQLPYIYALGGGLLFGAYTFMFASDSHQYAVFAAFVLAMSAIAFVLEARPLGLVAMIALAPTLAGNLRIELTNVATPGWLPAFGVAMVLAGAVFSDRRIVNAREGLAFHQMLLSPFFLYCSAALMISVSVLGHVDDHVRSAFFLAIAAAVSTVAIVALHHRALATATVILLAFATLSWLNTWDAAATAQRHFSAIVATAVCVLANRFFARGEKEVRLDVWGGVALALSWPIVFCYVASLGKDTWFFEPAQGMAEAVEGFGYYHSDWTPLFLAIVSFAYAGFAAVTRSRTSIGISALNATVVSLGIVMQSGQSSDSMATLPLICGFVALAAYWIACERLIAKSSSGKSNQIIDPLCGLCVAAATLLLVIMIERVPTLSNYFLAIGWGALATVLFVVAKAASQRFYRYAGLAVFVLAIGRLFYDARNLEGIYRPLAFIGLSIFMLIVSFGFYRAGLLSDLKVGGASTNKTPLDEPTSPPPGPPPIP